MVAAKTDAAHQGLSALFAAHDIERVYVALTRGSPRARRAPTRDDGPGLRLDQVDDQPPELRWILNPVLGLPKDQAERAGLGVVTTSAWRSTTGCAASTAPLAVASTNSGRLTSASLRDRAWPAERPASPAARRTALEASRAGRSRGHAEELSAESGDVLVVAAPVGRPGLRLVLSHAAHLRAEVRRADVYGNAVRPQQPL